MHVCLGPYDGSMDLGRSGLLEEVKKAGYDGVSVQMGILFGKRFIQDFSHEDWVDLRSYLRRLGLLAPTIMTPAFWPLAHPGYKTLACDLLRLYIECATFFGAAQVGIWPTHPVGVEKSQAVGAMTENLLSVLPEAKGKNVFIALEFEDRAVITNYEEMLEFVRATDPALRIICDTMHLAEEGTDPVKAVVDMGERIGMVHLSDTERLLPGRGGFNFNDFVGALRRIRYEGSIDVVFKCREPGEISLARRYVRSLGV